MLAGAFVFDKRAVPSTTESNENFSNVNKRQDQKRIVENSESSEFKFCGVRNSPISYIFTNKIATKATMYVVLTIYISKATPYFLFLR